MKGIKIVCGFVFAGWMLLSCQRENNSRIIPVNDFFKPQDRMLYRISPDGKRLSYLQLDGDKKNIHIENLETGKTENITNASDLSINFYSWVSNDELIYYKELGGPTRRTDIFIIDNDGKNERQLTANEKGRIRVIEDQLIDGKYLLVASNRRDSAVVDVYRLNVRNGVFEMAAKNPGNVTAWITDANGKLRLATSSDGLNETLMYREDERSAFKPVVTNSNVDKVWPVAFADNRPNVIYAISNVNRDKNALVEINCETGKESKVLFSNDKYNVIDAQYSRSKKRMAFVVVETWKKEKYYLDDAAKRLYTRLEKLLPNMETRVVDRDKSENAYIVRTFTDRNPGSFYLYLADKGTVRKLTDLNSTIKEEEMSKMEPIAYEARDGMKIQGYLTLPLNKDPKNLPVIVLPHGGPNGRNSWGYSADVQFLANRGYAVLQVNYRGSTGYGKKFLSAGFKQWGTKINDDVEDGVRWLVKEKIANPKRVAIYGSGFGGFIALSSIYRNPGTYACAAANSGVINLFSYLKSFPPYYQSNLNAYYDMIGNPHGDSDNMTQSSPVFHADRIKVPVFIAVNTSDARSNAGETMLYVKELKKKNVNVTYFESADPPFGGGRDARRQQFYATLEAFFGNNLDKK